MHHFKAWATATVIAATLALALASPAAALSIIKQSGETGDWGTFPHADTSDAKCGYVDGSIAGSSDLHQINVYAIGAAPAGGRATQKVAWWVTIQSMPQGGGAWKRVVSSAKQIGTATSSDSPNYKNVKLTFKSKPDRVYRAVSTINWLAGGNVSGVLKFAHGIYATKFGSQASSTLLEDYCYGRILD